MTYFYFLLPIVPVGVWDVAWLLVVDSVLDGIEFEGMSAEFEGRSLEIELSSTTSKVGHDGEDDCDG